MLNTHKITRFGAADLGPPGTLLGLSWGPSWGPSWGHSWGLLEHSWGSPEPFWGSPGVSWGSPGAPPGVSWGSPRASPGRRDVKPGALSFNTGFLLREPLLELSKTLALE